ncbi:hypothetical protein [Nostoc sp. 106C]|uniref:hypothetical protein n=1 Tax=Nostoc sp. 106C TaxID=1932667 RepID=UPI000A377C4B|nr:hypothetical protein [Nostoc sp. 106C]OUL28578.1 hypothetical protein BV375_17935 [Nostoc sp. 106C]
MENQESKKALETTVELDRSSATDRGAEIESDTSSVQNVENVEVEKQEPKKVTEIIVESDRSPGTDRGL